MLNFFLALSVFTGLLLLFSFSVLVGRNVGLRQLGKHPQHKLEVVSVAEGAVFGLLALLIAFSFSGAYQRFEQRKMHIIEEANAFETAYERVDLLPAHTQTALHNDMLQYIDLRLAAYNAIPFYAEVYRYLDQSQQLQNKIWKEVVAASEEDANQGLAPLVIPTLNTLFEMENVGIDLTVVHPPIIVFGLLIGLAILGSFLAGYSTAENSGHKSIHILCYIILTAFTIYIIIDLELPRMGLIRVTSFDRILQNAKNEMEKSTVIIPANAPSRHHI